MRIDAKISTSVSTSAAEHRAGLDVDIRGLYLGEAFGYIQNCRWLVHFLGPRSQSALVMRVFSGWLGPGSE